MNLSPKLLFTSSWFHPAQQGCETSQSNSCLLVATSELKLGKLLSGVRRAMSLLPFRSLQMCRVLCASLVPALLPQVLRCLPDSAASRGFRCPAMDDDSQDELINKNAALGKGKRQCLALLSETGKCGLSAPAPFCFGVAEPIDSPSKGW